MKQPRKNYTSYCVLTANVVTSDSVLNFFLFSFLIFLNFDLILLNFNLNFFLIIHKSVLAPRIFP